MKTVLIILLVIAAIMSFIGITNYNRLVKQSQDVNTQWAQVQTAYQHRADLIPNLVEIVQGSATLEQKTLMDVSEARASIGKLNIDPAVAPADGAKLGDYQRAQAQLSGALTQLLAVSEAYSDLKTNAGFRDLQTQLEATESRISIERQRYNEVVQGYDTSVNSFPSGLVAALCGFKEKPYFTESGK